MVYVFFLPNILILLYGIALILSICSYGTIPAPIFFAAFLGITIYGAIKKKKKIPVEPNKPVSSTELRITEKEEECPHCHKMSEKKYNICEYCETIKH